MQIVKQAPFTIRDVICGQQKLFQAEDNDAYCEKYIVAIKVYLGSQNS